MRSQTDLLVSASAAVFGLVSWSIAHLVTYLLFAHTHDGPIPYTHIHEGVGSIIVATIAFLATSVAASMLGSASSPVAGWAQRVQPGSLMAAAAPAAFVLVELGEHFASGDEGPPATLLVIGVVLHAAMGAVTPLLWSGFVRPAVITLLVELTLRSEAVEQLQAVVPVEPSWTAPPLLSPSSSRGPPVPGHGLASPCLTSPIGVPVGASRAPELSRLWAAGCFVPGPQRVPYTAQRARLAMKALPCHRLPPA